MLNFVTFFKNLIKRSIYLISISFSLFWSGINAIVRIMRPRKRDFRGDARKGAKNYDTVSSDDSEVYRRKDPFAGRNRKRLPVRTGGRNAISATLLFDLDGHPIECLFFALLSTNAQATAAGYYRKYQSSEQRAAVNFSSKCCKNTAVISRHVRLELTTFF